MTTLAWQSGGSAAGPAVVLVHSWASDGPADWAATGWVDALTAAGHALWVPDLPGHGESADVVIPPGTEPAGWTARTILADLDRLRVPAFAVVGYADGCLTAGHLSVLAPERVGRAVLVGCDDRLAIPSGGEVAAALTDPTARVWNPDVSEAVRRARRDRRHHLPTLAHWAHRVAWPAAPRLGSLRTPVLLAVGADDAPRRERAPRLAALFHDATVVTAPGDRRGALGSAQLHRTAVDFLAEAAPPA
jgi:pimeloyl-ACP methyl ester carboxylesterase